MHLNKKAYIGVYLALMRYLYILVILAGIGQSLLVNTMTQVWGVESLTEILQQETNSHEEKEAEGYKEIDFLLYKSNNLALAYAISTTEKSNVYITQHQFKLDSEKKLPDIPPEV